MITERQRANSKAYLQRHRTRILAERRAKRAAAKTLLNCQFCAKQLGPKKTKFCDSKCKHRFFYPIRAAKKSAAKRRRKYGITETRFFEMLAVQGGVCAICKKKPRHFVVDHCHQTEAVRGLLCRACNLGIGNLGEDPDTLRNAMMYIVLHRLGDTSRGRTT